jgi:hypothetical protein
MPKVAEPKQIIESEVEEVFALQKDLEETEQLLMQNEQFRKFLQLQKTVPEQIDKIWKNVEEQMLAHDIKSIKGDWGSLTIAERLNWSVDLEALPPKFFKKVPDTTKLTNTFRLEGKAPKGAEPRYTKYLHKRIK